MASFEVVLSEKLGFALFSIFGERSAETAASWGPGIDEFSESAGR